MILWTWFLTFIKGFIPIDGKRIGKILWVLAICACAIGVYHKLFIAKAQNTVIQQGGTQIINQCPEDNKVFGVGINIWKFKIKLGI